MERFRCINNGIVEGKTSKASAHMLQYGIIYEGKLYEDRVIIKGHGYHYFQERFVKLPNINDININITIL